MAMLSAPLVQRYLKGLGLLHAPRPTMSGLATLLRAHLARIPYGNLDIHTGKPVSPLEPADALAERLLCGRGGYCFHLAPPFCALLNSLGFDARIYPGQVVSHPGSPPEPASPNHAVVIVSSLADAPTQHILADVGIGDGPRNPVPLRPGVVKHEAPFVFGIERLDGGASSWRFLHDARGGFAHFDVSVEAPVSFEAFIEPHRQLSTLPESIFVQTFTVQRVDDGLIEKLVNRSFLRVTSAGTTKVVIETERQFGSLLGETFELNVSDADRGAIWRSVLDRERAG